MSEFEAVLFDWRGTLAYALTRLEWIKLGLKHAGRDDSDASANRLRDQIGMAPGASRLDSSDIDADATLHRNTYLSVLAEAGLDAELAHALYDVESDASHNPFADDAADVLTAIKARGLRVGVISDIHFDLRSAFQRAELDGLIDLYVLSFEHGTQKPEPAMFRVALDALSLNPAQVLMVGDRAGYDGAAVDVGIVTLLLPPLTSVQDRRLHLVEALLPRKQ